MRQLPVSLFHPPMLRSFFNTTNVAHSRRGPLVEDWRAICQAIHRGVEGAEWENLYHKFVEMNKEVQGSQRPSSKWKQQGQDAVEDERREKERCDAYSDQTSELTIVNREAVRHELWNTRLLNPALALAEVLPRVEVWDSMARGTRS